MAGQTVLSRHPYDYVVQQYPDTSEPLKVTPLGNLGGFSGSRLWRVVTAGDSFCLRRWPVEFQDLARLEWIHAVLRGVYGQGVEFIPVPRRSLAGQTMVSYQGYFWELIPWMPGTADYQTFPSEARLQSAMQTLARFHVAARLVMTEVLADLPPGLIHRRASMNRWLTGQVRVLDDCLQRNRDHPLRQIGVHVLRLFLELAPGSLPALDRHTHIRVPLQPCIRDVWHDHVLFTGSTVTGLVDFGAMRVDTVATDIARLLGSLVADDQASWTKGVAYYEAIHPLLETERELIATFDFANVLLSGMQWLEWIFIQQRQFDDWSNVNARLDHWISRLATRTSSRSNQ